MNRFILSLDFAASALLLGSCSKNKLVCTNLPNTALYFTTGSGAVQLSYTGYKIEAYTQGTNFTKQDTAILVAAGELVKDVSVKITQPYLSASFDKHDWIITFYPSGKQFKITNVIRAHKKDASLRQLQEGVKCYNGFKFLLNGAAHVSSNSDVLVQPDYEYVYIQY